MLPYSYFYGLKDKKMFIY